jgi:RimJ/RimL family protein N-acetyltransferase
VIRGEKIGLRARTEADVPVLHRGLYEDVVHRTRADDKPWRPIAAESGHSPFAVGEPSPDAAPFSVVEPDSGELAGSAALWGIDTHNRSAHIGMALLPAFRGRGLGTDVVRTLCEYGFAGRGLRRLQVETLADNAPMLGAARAAGFTVEGTLRSAAWVYGGFADEVVLGLLAEEWTAGRVS